MADLFSNINGPYSRSPSSVDQAQLELEEYAKKMKADADQERLFSLANKQSALQNYTPQVDLTPAMAFIGSWTGNKLPLQAYQKPEQAIDRVALSEKLGAYNTDSDKLMYDALKSRLSNMIADKRADAYDRAVGVMGTQKSGPSFDNKDFIKDLSKSNAKSVFGYARLKPLVGFLSDPGKSESDKAKAILDNAKLLNDMYGSDAVAKEEIGRIMSDIQLAIDPATGKVDPRPNIQAGIQRVVNRLGLLKETIKETNSIINKAKKGNLEEALDFSNEPSSPPAPQGDNDFENFLQSRRK